MYGILGSTSLLISSKRKSATLRLRSLFVGIPGLEPGKAGPESAVLPLHHIPISFATEILLDCECKGTAKILNLQIFSKLFSI